ncbi:DEAD/DEAH box helicase [Corynebacterium sp. 153RC1]|uniref:DNA glycosylase AlkZ-like family protein n=1 Tax=unclassified Corynebacterium TaxID=2624378 RepID=UPI00211C473C|nr:MULTISPECIES: crosslink repair DNA glycosylase YcaQ family protein [unclassified Corynebacterium]MCQ9353321.1 DEAD/DEAH box helicase [Corynebacterium sp. 209RC1]MCQ9355576.1 DEAD/DEAH box helicase [Corynebacterium sp. 1222RC1]MCQ9357760.1 DEAD/DEAH box helicase [Corynebacterium sp. 122RC1]MCQ9359965.1 DEAD/DEAH box helicase [Corynebacterium sp. 142RC1]MCQ9362097.1 DEAD/DEAH box helicase [Corynebacterium sp. 153RC1]
MSSTANESILTRFQPQVSTWFSEVFAAPTAVQQQAWEAISAGENALVVAPTGSGKTLAAFLWALNGLTQQVGQTTLVLPEIAHEPAAKTTQSGVKVLYISPLKALGVDVERNLRAPLAGINNVALRLGLEPSNISVGVRSGDTPAAERNRQLRRPPDILITTPESAYLMLTSKAAGILRNVETVIIDEIHAIAGTKRGVHLALTLERLEHLVGKPVQRVGLSATVRPLDLVAKFLGGDRPVEIINPPAEKLWELNVHVPVEDMSDLPTAEPGSTIGEITVEDSLGITTALPTGDPLFDPAPTAAPAIEPTSAPDPSNGSIWPHIAREVYQEIMASRSTLVFVNSRRTAEKLTSQINELYAVEHAPDALAAPQRRPPAQVMSPGDVAGLTDPLIARAHHGSVSKDERAQIETMLKEGSLRAVVSTSSLELGIDMGAVDLVIQVESPPSVASGLQRVGRAGHVVGAVSHGSMYPKHRQDLVQTAVTVARMREGLIEELSVPKNALDVLTQHTIAAVSMEDLHVDEWFALVTRAYPYQDLDRAVFDAVIDLASGVYPSTDFAELRPRIIFDRITGMLSARPGAQRVAVTSGGTIPDRGMFGVFLVGGEQGARRVGELDEEMVYESRVGDVFTLGASSWRIEEITRDQVLVTPAPGLTGRLPFWTGDQLGRPYELGLALGAFRRAVHADPSTVQRAELGLDENAQNNVLRFLEQQKEDTGMVPDEQTLLLERFRDELGDWRVVLHAPFGRGVNAAWALAVGAKIAQETGMDAQPVSSDDGIVLRLPDADTQPSAELFLLDPDEVEEIVAAQVGNSALFASRFRECAARALLLPRRNPGKRAPLWQQRQRAAQLLDVARQYPSFPIILETVRECLHDVYDLPALVEVQSNLRLRKIQIAEVTTQNPSAFASSILFNYTGAFMYEGDSPLAEKRAAALALDPTLLAKLLGAVELRELLDQEVITEVHEQLQRTAESRRAKTPEQLVDALRILGPIPLETAQQRCTFALDQAALATVSSRVMQVRIAGVEHLAGIHDAPLLRDALGVPVPAGVPAPVEPITDALEQLVRRWVRTRGPFQLAQLQEAFGLPASVAHQALMQLVQDQVVIEGRFRQGIDGQEYVAKEVLATLRSRSLAMARAQTQPVSQSAFARFLPAWQQVAPVGQAPQLHGVDGVLAVIEQLAGVRLPASAWESMVLPSRVRGYQPAWLDELLISGEVLVVGAGQAGANDPWVRLLPVDYAAQLLPLPDELDVASVEPDEPDDGSSTAQAPQTSWTSRTSQTSRSGYSHIQQQIVEFLSRGGGFRAQDIFAHVTGEDLGLVAGQASLDQISEAMWGLFEAGVLSPDGFAGIRARLARSRGGSAAHRAKRTPQRSRLRMGRTSFANAAVAGGGVGSGSPGTGAGAQRGKAAHAPELVGRWSLSVAPDTNATSRSVAHGEAWLDRYGVVTRGSVQAEDVLGGFALAYKVLSGFEESGKALRGYVVEGLGAAQFSTPAVIDRLRGMDDSPDPTTWPSGSEEPDVYLLAACDPANPYGAALPWPGEHRVSRAAGAVVVLADGLPLAHLSRGGKTLTLFAEEQDTQTLNLHLPLIVWALGQHPQRNLTIETINATPALQSPLLSALRQAGASITPRGVRIPTAQHSSADAPSAHSGTDSFGVQGRKNGRSLADALEYLPQDGTPEPRTGGFRSGGYRRR